MHLLLALVLAICCGCKPDAMRLVVRGQQLMSRGQYPDAANTLALAVTVAQTNAVAWHELGVAYLYCGRMTNAVQAFRKALVYDRDLWQSKLNLGMVYLALDRPELARSEFTSCVLQAPREASGWVGLGYTLLRLKDYIGAERSFLEALKLHTNNARALNGWALVQLHRGRTKEAQTGFQAAADADPRYDAAVLNLAVCTHTQVKDPVLALERYRAYLHAFSNSAEAPQVRALVQALEAQLRRSPMQVPSGAGSGQHDLDRATNGLGHTMQLQERTLADAAVLSARWDLTLMVTNAVQAEVRGAASDAHAERSGQSAASGSAPAVADAVRRAPVRVQSLQSEVAVGGAGAGPEPVQASPASKQEGAQQPGRVALGSTDRPSTSQQGSGVTIPGPQYKYGASISGVRGDRQVASALLKQGFEAFESGEMRRALDLYRRAVGADPGWFEAQYNLGLAAYELRDYGTALTAFEAASKINPTNTDAIYGFALVLRDAGYPSDAVVQLQRMLALDPSDVRAHLALGNLYALRLGDKAKARSHYTRVLELAPGHPRADAIKRWLMQNGP